MKIFRSICIALLLMFLALGAAAESADTEQKEAVNSHIYLVYGIDISGSLKETARTDAMLIVQVDHTHQKVRVASIARDSLVDNGRGTLVKINTLVRKDYDVNKGTQLLLNAIKKNFGVEPEGWFRINFDSVTSIVDAIGGVDIDITAEEAKYINMFAKTSKDLNLTVQDGVAHLNGIQSLTFIRCRHLDNDLGRGKRQTRFVSALLSKAKNISPLEIISLFNSLNGAWISSYGLLDQLALIKELLPARNYSFESISIPFSGTWRNGQKDDVRGVIMDLGANRKKLLEAFQLN